MTATQNTVSAVALAITAAMNDATKADNRQNEVIKTMFNDDGATYTTSRLAHILRQEGKDKTEALDDLLCDVSDDFDNICGKIDLLTEERKKAHVGKAKKEEIAFDIEKLNNKRKAARAMMERCIKSVFHLRTIGATNVSLTKKGRLSVKQPDLEQEVKEGETRDMIRVDYSGRELVNASSTSVDALKPKANENKNNKNKNNTVNVAEGLRSALESSRKYLETLNKPLSDLADSTEEEAEKLLKALMRMKFADDKGVVHKSDVLEYFFPNIKKEEKKNAA